MRAALLFCLCFGIMPAYGAERVSTQPFGQIRLTDAACTNKAIVNQILPQWVPKFKAGRGVITDKVLAKHLGVDVFDFCWITHEGQIVIVDQFGDTVGLDPSQFEEVKGGA